MSYDKIHFQYILEQQMAQIMQFFIQVRKFGVLILATI